jgi:HAD superfamily hydrolase (TIGR01549 family)
VTVRAVFFDVGETLVDEERYWRGVAEAEGVGPHVVWAALGVTIARGEEHWELWRHLGIERPADAWETIGYSTDDLYPDAIAGLEGVRAAGMVVGIAGNQNAALEAWVSSVGLPADLVTSSAGLGARKPDSAFFEGIASLAGLDATEIAYVGDRVDNDVRPARAAGIAVESLTDLPDALEAVG